MLDPAFMTKCFKRITIDQNDQIEQDLILTLWLRGTHICVLGLFVQIVVIEVLFTLCGKVSLVVICLGNVITLSFYVAMCVFMCVLSILTCLLLAFCSILIYFGVLSSLVFQDVFSYINVDCKQEPTYMFRS